MGLGAGLIIAAVLMSFVPGKNLKKSDIENQARGFGMKYPSEMKVIEEGK